MKQFFHRIGAGVQRWMAGRYGIDELSKALSIAAIAGLLLSCIPALRFLYIPALIVWVWSLVRSYSRKIEKRQAERTAYLRFTGRVKSWFSLKKRAWQERGTHRYFRCKQCKTVLRVPKGKGKIKITCSHCHSEFVKKT